MPTNHAKHKDPMAVLWVSNNRNALSTIARECDCTVQFVSYVLYGQRRSANGKVERMLRQLGAPVRGR